MARTSRDGTAEVRCPRCGDAYGPDADVCASCELPLQPPDRPGPEARLGRFHPVMAERLQGVLEQRAIPHRRVDRDDDVELLVDTAHRDRLRAELALNWAQLVHGLPAEHVTVVLAAGGAAPGWFDAPAGGWVDRAGRLVVEPAADDPTAVDEPRLTGPLLAGLGALLLLLGWYVGAPDVVVVVGGGLAILGVLLPR